MVNHPVRCFSLNFGEGKLVPEDLIELDRCLFLNSPPSAGGALGSAPSLLEPVAVVVADVDVGVSASPTGSELSVSASRFFKRLSGSGSPIGFEP